MFEQCEALTDIDFGTTFNLPNLTSMRSIFNGCLSIIDIDLSSFVTSDKLTDMYDFIYFCTSLESIKIGSGFNTTSVTDYGNAFAHCDKLKVLDLTGLESADITDRTKHYYIKDVNVLDPSKYLKDLIFIRTPNTLTTSPNIVDEHYLDLPNLDTGAWIGYKDGVMLDCTFDRLVDKSICDALIFIQSNDIEKQMIDYQTLPANIKEYYEKDEYYSSYLDDLFRKYYNLIKSYECETKKDLSKEGEFFEAFGVINRLDKDKVSDPVTLDVEKIIDVAEIDELRETIKDTFEEGEDILVPYDIKLMSKGVEKQPKAEDRILVKIELPIEYYYGILNVVRNHNGLVEKLIEGTEIWKNKTNLGGKEQLNLYFYSDKFSTFTLTTSIPSVVVKSEYEEGVDKTKNYIVGGNQIPLKDKDGNLKDNVTVQVNLDPTKTKALVYQGDTLLHTLTKKTNTFTIDRNEANRIYLTIKYEKLPDNGGGNGAGGNTGSITTQTITIQVSDHTSYINGYKDGTFKADRNMTRAEFAKIICELSQNYNLSYKDDLKKELTKYSDIKDNAWYSNYAGYVIKTGIMKGYKDSFRPNDYITRAEVCKVLNDTYGIGNKVSNVSSTNNKYTNELNGHWYENSVTNLVKANYIKGYPDGTFKPLNNITRAEIVSLVNRVINREVKVDATKVSDGYKNTIKTKLKDVTSDKWYYLDVLEASVSHNSNDMH